MIKEITAIVAAGGTGSRLGLTHPKSGLLYKGHSLIYWTAYSLYLAGVNNINIYVNNKLWANKFKDELHFIPGCQVIVDPGYDNTFQLFKAYYSLSEKYLFTYGHTPRPVASYKKLISFEESLNYSCVQKTTKKSPIKTAIGLIEPPYMVEPSKLSIDELDSWQDFFQENCSTSGKFIELKIGEFNYLCDWLNYQTYLASTMFSSLFHKGQLMFS